MILISLKNNMLVYPLLNSNILIIMAVISQRLRWWSAIRSKLLLLHQVMD